MMWVDYVILGVIAVSVLVAFFRGFVREAVGLTVWILAFWAAFQLAPVLETLLSAWMDARFMRWIAVFAIVFIAVLILGAVANHFLGKLVSETGFAGTDRMLGAIFGVLRGVVLLVFMVLLAGLTAIPEYDWWKDSVLIDQLEQGALWVSDWLPEGIAEEVHFKGIVSGPEHTQQSTQSPSHGAL